MCWADSACWSPSPPPHRIFKGLQDLYAERLAGSSVGHDDVGHCCSLKASSSLSSCQISEETRLSAAAPPLLSSSSSSSCCSSAVAIPAVSSSSSPSSSSCPAQQAACPSQGNHVCIRLCGVVGGGAGVFIPAEGQRLDRVSLVIYQTAADCTMLLQLMIDWLSGFYLFSVQSVFRIFSFYDLFYLTHAEWSTESVLSSTSLDLRTWLA